MTVEKIITDIKKTKAKISELQNKLKTLETKKIEAENSRIINLVKAVKMDTAHLTVFLKAYAKGDIALPDEYMKELEAAETANADETEDGENEE